MKTQLFRNFVRLMFFYVFAGAFFWYILKLDINSILVVFVSALLIAMISVWKYTRPLAYLMVITTFLYIIFVKIPVYPYQINNLSWKDYELLTLLADEDNTIINSKAWVFINNDKTSLKDLPKNFSSLKNLKFSSTQGLNTRLILITPTGGVLLIYPQTSIVFSWKNIILESGKTSFSGINVFIQNNKYTNTSLAYKPDEVLFASPISSWDKEAIKKYYKKFDYDLRSQFERNYAWNYTNTPTLDYIIEAKMKYGQFLDPSLENNYKNYLTYKSLSWKKNNF